MHTVAVQTGICSFRSDPRSGGVPLQQATRALEAAWQCHGELPNTIHYLEQRQRAGDIAARGALAGLVPCAALRDLYTINTVPRLQLQLSLCPDITQELTQAMLKFRNREDSLVTFLRSSIPALNLFKKIHRDIAWPEEHSTSLRKLFFCCLPTLLSLFPCPSTKEVSLDVRISLFWSIRVFVAGRHADALEFFNRHKHVLRVCLVEYAFHSLSNMPMIPLLLRYSPACFQTLKHAVFNMGQHLRVEMNTALVNAKGADEIWPCLCAAAKILYDRYVRVSKSVAGQVRPHATQQHKPATVNKKSVELVTVYQQYDKTLSEMPQTNSFHVAEMYMRRAGVRAFEISTLWDAIMCVRVHELPACVLQRQIQKLFHLCAGSNRQMRKRSHLLVCRFCLMQNVTTVFRFDSYYGNYICNRCELNGSVVDVCMLGRIVYVRNIPLVLCTSCLDVVVYSGAGSELSPCPHTHAPHSMLACPRLHIRWGSSLNINALDNLVKNCSPYQFIYANINLAPQPCLYVEFHPDHTVARRFLPAKSCTPRRCSMCRCTSIFASYLLLDPEVHQLVHVQVCYKHSIPTAVQRWALHTINDYIRIHQAPTAE